MRRTTPQSLYLDMANYFKVCPDYNLNRNYCQEYFDFLYINCQALVQKIFRCVLSVHHGVMTKLIKNETSQFLTLDLKARQLEMDNFMAPYLRRNRYVPTLPFFLEVVRRNNLFLYDFLELCTLRCFCFDLIVEFMTVFTPFQLGLSRHQETTPSDKVDSSLNKLA